MENIFVLHETVTLIIAEATNLQAQDSPSAKHVCGLLAALASQVGELCAYVAAHAVGSNQPTPTLPVDSAPTSLTTDTSGH